MKNSRKKGLSSISKVIPLVFLFVFLIPNTSGYNVEPVWRDLDYYQGDIAQFTLQGDKNQTNISCAIRYYYRPNPFLNDTKSEYVKWLDVPPLDGNGTGTFEFLLNESNGFNKIGNYNLTFVFGVDKINESGIEVWTAPRVSHHIKVDLSLAYLLATNQENNKEIANTVSSGIDHVNKVASDVYLVMIIFFILFSLFVFNWLWEKKYHETFITSFLKIVKATWKKYRSPTGNLDDILNPMTSIDAFRRLWRGLDNQIGVNERALRRKEEEVEKLKSDLEKWERDRDYFEDAILTANPDDPHLSSPIIILRDDEGAIKRIVQGRVERRTKYKRLKKDVKADG